MSAVRLGYYAQFDPLAVVSRETHAMTMIHNTHHQHAEISDRENEIQHQQ
jgi:hypothetical protein